MKKSFTRRVLYRIYDALRVFGTIYTGVEPESLAAAGGLPSPRLTGPSAAHPERLAPEIPLTPLELALLRELDHR